MLKLYNDKSTVLCHFYNEKWMLPHWIKHHVEMFDDGIMINYASTDESVDIIKQLAPHWKILDTANQWFDAELCDTEIMKIEETICGWKMVLNVTEYLIISDFKQLIRNIEKSGLSMIRSKGYRIIDTKAEFEAGFDNSKSLVSQRYHGQIDPWRSRTIHKHKNGSYYIGRHNNVPVLLKNPYSLIEHKDVPIFDGFNLFWYKFAPFKEQLPRKIQISARIPQSDIDKNMGWNHWNLDEKKIYDRWLEEEPKNINLLDIPEIKREHEILSQNYLM